jgi:hypothetical protein
MKNKNNETSINVSIGNYEKAVIDGKTRKSRNLVTLANLPENEQKNTNLHIFD